MLPRLDATIETTVLLNGRPANRQPRLIVRPFVRDQLQTENEHLGATAAEPTMRGQHGGRIASRDLFGCKHSAESSSPTQLADLAQRLASHAQQEASDPAIAGRSFWAIALAHPVLVEPDPDVSYVAEAVARCVRAGRRMRSSARVAVSARLRGDR